MISFYDVDGRMGLKNVWDLIDWDKHRQTVSRIQTRIVKAVKKGLKERVRGLQRLLSNSLAAKLIAIKRVISNKGKRTPGADNILIDTPKKRWETLKNLNLPDYKAKPLKRIYIPKKNGKKRPLGIMTGWNRLLICWGLIRYLNLRLIIIPMDSGKLTRFILSGTRMISL